MTRNANDRRVIRSLLKWLLIVLVVANIVVWSAWPLRDELVARGILEPPPVERVDLDPRALPPIVDRTRTERGADQPDDSLHRDPLEGEEIEDVRPTVPPDAVDPLPASPEIADETSVTEPPMLPALLDCVVAGPIDNREAEAMAMQLRAAGAIVDAPEEAGVGPTGYLVYIKPAASHEAASLILSELQAQSIEDAEVLSSEPYENAVAVGAYGIPNRDLADARRDQITALGYDVIVRERRAATYRLRARRVPADALDDLPYEPCQDDEPR